MEQGKDMKIVFDFIIRKFPNSDGFEVIKEMMKANFNIPKELINSKYKIYYVDSKENEIPLSNENDIKLMFSILNDHGISKIKLQLKKINDDFKTANTPSLVDSFRNDESSLIKRRRGRPKNHINTQKKLINHDKKKRMMKEIQNSWSLEIPFSSNKGFSRNIKSNDFPLKIFRNDDSLEKSGKIQSKTKSKNIFNQILMKPFVDNIYKSMNHIPTIQVPLKRFRYKKNVKSDDSKIEKWLLNARFMIRQYKKAKDKNSSYVITYEGKNKIKIQFRIRGPDKKFRCKGKLIHFENDCYDEKWDSQIGTKKMETFLNFALENFENLGKKASLYDF